MIKKVIFIFGVKWSLTGRTVTQQPCCRQSEEAPSTLTSMFQNIALPTHFLCQRFLYVLQTISDIFQKNPLYSEIFFQKLLNRASIHATGQITLNSILKDIVCVPGHAAEVKLLWTQLCMRMKYMNWYVKLFLKFPLIISKTALSSYFYKLYKFIKICKIC